MLYPQHTSKYRSQLNLFSLLCFPFTKKVPEHFRFRYLKMMPFNKSFLTNPLKEFLNLFSHLMNLVTVQGPQVHKGKVIQKIHSMKNQLIQQIEVIKDYLNLYCYHDKKSFHIHKSYLVLQFYLYKRYLLHFFDYF